MVVTANNPKEVITLQHLINLVPEFSKPELQE